LGRFLSDDPLTADATTPQARDPYPYAAGDPIDGTDPSGQCIAGPDVNIGCNPSPSPPPPPQTPPPPPPVCVTSKDKNGNTTYPSCRLDTDQVGRMHAPYGWQDICGPGSARIVLAFTAALDTINKDSPGAEDQVVGMYAAGTPENWTASTTGSHPDGPGTDFMMYLAKQITVCDKGGMSSSGTGAMSSALEKLSGPLVDAKGNIKYKTVGRGKHKRKVARKPTFTFRNGMAENGSKRPESEMDTAVQSSLQHGVPAIVAAEMVMLPSQAMLGETKSDHFVSVVAYDANYYYYVDTCWTGEACGYSGSARYDPYKTDNTTPQFGTDSDLAKFHAAKGDDPTSLAYRKQYPGTWRIAKGDLWSAVSAKTGLGWFIYSGNTYGYSQGN
jgi:hypothetical protein